MKLKTGDLTNLINNIMKTLIVSFSFFFICSLLYSQNITTTLGTSGIFTIKDASNNYLTLSQSTGQINILKTLRLENTTSSSLGIIFKGADRFIHNYGSGNTFMGINSGNFTMTGALNTALGFITLYLPTQPAIRTQLWDIILYIQTPPAS